MNKNQRKLFLNSALEQFSKDYDEKSLKSALTTVSGKKITKRFVHLSDIKQVSNDLGLKLTLELV